MKKLLKRLRFLLKNRVGLVAGYALLLYGIPPFSGGGGDDEEKAARRQEDVTRQNRRRAEERAAELKAEQGQIADRLREELLDEVAPTGLESDRIGRIRSGESELGDLLKRLVSGAGIGSITGPIGERLEQTILGDLDKPREIPFEDTFEPQFDLLRQKIGAEAAQRGLVGSGLELENLGRAGIDLAVQTAQQRQQSRQVNEQLRQQAIANAVTGGTNLENIGQQRTTQFQNFLRGLQALEDSRRGREVSIGRDAAVLPAQLRQTGNLGAIGERSTAEGQIFGLESEEVLGARKRAAEAKAAQDQALGQLAGLAAGAATSFIPGVGPVLAPIVGQGVSGAAGGGGGNLLGSFGGFGTPTTFPGGRTSTGSQSVGSLRDFNRVSRNISPSLLAGFGG